MTKRFELTADHIKLLQHAHIRWEDCEYGAPAIDCKRPYGNSCVEEDIAEILGWAGFVEIDGEKILPDEVGAKAKILHAETETALQIILYTKHFQPGTYILQDDYSTDWKYAGEIK